VKAALSGSQMLKPPALPKDTFTYFVQVLISLPIVFFDFGRIVFIQNEQQISLTEAIMITHRSDRHFFQHDPPIRM
jgi:hypothetical protein